ncbi:MAG: Ribonuclease H [Chloroflexi bacterium ADurb.Bin325]|nr:MAG: Ribonuclease H [Chloroflexi bacterium ADurb.Bin325]
MAEAIRLLIFTDGACAGNPGPGGWAAIMQYGEHEKVLQGGASLTTNNRMELRAAIAAFQALTRPCAAEVYTDSEYLRRGITEWLATWQRNGWRTATRQPVKNQDLWRALQAAMRPHRVTWHWVKGHAGHPLNERADRLAVAALNTLGVTGQPDLDGPAPGLLE